MILVEMANLEIVRKRGYSSKCKIKKERNQKRYIGSIIGIILRFIIWIFPL